MTVYEYLIWQKSEPDTFELTGGVPMRVPDEKQGARRVGNLSRAAYIALGNGHLDWLSNPLSAGLRPVEIASQSWTGLEDLLAKLPWPTNDFRLFGDTFSDIAARARRLARIERQRHALMLAAQMCGENEGRAFIGTPHPLLAGRTPGELAADGCSGLREVIGILIRLREQVIELETQART